MPVERRGQSSPNGRVHAWGKKDRARRAIRNIRQRLPNSVPNPRASCILSPPVGEGIRKLAVAGAKTTDWLDRLSGVITPRMIYAGIQAKRFGPNSPAGALAKAGFRDFLDSGLKAFGENVALSAGVSGFVGGLESVGRNVTKVINREISPANFAGRVGYGVGQGATKGVASTAMWAGIGAAGGAIIGGAVGFFGGGGVGAVPGAVLGAKIGANVGMAVGPLFDKIFLHDKVGNWTDSIVEKVLPQTYEEAVGRFADTHKGALIGAMAGIFGPVGAAAGFLIRR